MSTHIAIDLGAESGRVILGTVADGRLHMLPTVHRFLHKPVPTPAGLVWDFTGIWNHILEGLRLAAEVARQNKLSIASVGVDTWGVDFAIVDQTGVGMTLPRCYRDPAFNAAFDSVLKRLDRKSIYDATGIQLMTINSLYQYALLNEIKPPSLDAGTLLFMPDLFHFLLSGVRSVERTIASTSQMVDARTGTWNASLLGRVGVSQKPLISPSDPGTTIGTILPAIAAATGLDANIKVVLPPAHDTAAAVFATPANASSNWCYLSSGTWSLLGCELDKPCITDASFEANFTNELGFGGTTRFLKNIAGLWLVQECRRQWEREGKTFDYAELTKLAARATPMRTLIDAADVSLIAPGEMPQRIAKFAAARGEPEPTSPGEFVRCCLESLAVEYRATHRKMTAILRKTFDVIHIIGGGSKNDLLNQMTADATGCTVLAGPDEATAMGNLLAQAVGCGTIADANAARDVARASSELRTFTPGDGGVWADASKRVGKEG